jgi:hypothetical protein
MSLFLCTGVAAPRSRGTARPPTLDPTYNLSQPRAERPAERPVASGAKWIWAARTLGDQRVGLRRDFTLEAKPAAATLLATVDNFFTLFVNGQKVGGTTPDPKNADVWREARRFDIAPLLVSGKNTLALEVTNAGGPGGAVAVLQIGEGRQQQDIVTDEAWKVQESPADGWARPDTDDSTWPSATVEAPLGGGPWADGEGLRNWPGLKADPPHLAHIAVSPVAVTVLSAGKAEITGANQMTRKGELLIRLPASGLSEADAPNLLVDFGQEITGRVQIDSASTGPVRVAISLGESDDEALNGPFTGIQRREIPPMGSVTGPNSAYRYARIAFLSGPQPIRIRSIRCEHVYYPVQYRGAFDCSDPLLTRIWYTGAFTAHLCMQNDIWDAPKRDRLPWMGDLHVSGEVINNVFLDRFLMQKTMDRLRADAGIPMRGHVNGIPGYSCAWVGGQADLYRHTGDLDYLKKQHDALISLLDFFRGELDERGIFANKRGQWPFVDWSPDFNEANPHTLKATHLYLIRELREAAWMLKEMGDQPAASRYEQWAADASDAAQRYLADPSTNTFGSRWQENTWAVLSGITTPAQQAAIWNRVLSQRYPAELFMTPYQHNYTLQAMSALGHTRQALEFVRWYWGGMLAEGATSTWEGYDPRWPKEHFHRELQADNGKGYFVSLAHGWSAGATTWLTQAILGVRPIEPGMRRVSIRPDLVDLQWARGTVPTPRGPITFNVRKEKSVLRADLTLPEGTTANFALPGQPAVELGPGRHSVSAPVSEGVR